MIDTPFLDGIRTHQGKVKSVIKPPLYLQAAMPGLNGLINQATFYHLKTGHRKVRYSDESDIQMSGTRIVMLLKHLSSDRQI